VLRILGGKSFVGFFPGPASFGSGLDKRAESEPVNSFIPNSVADIGETRGRALADWQSDSLA